MPPIPVTPGSLTCRLRNSDATLGEVVELDDTGFTVRGQLPAGQAPYLELALQSGRGTQNLFSYVTRTPKGLRGRWVPLDKTERTSLEDFLGAACGQRVTLRIPEPSQRKAEPGSAATRGSTPPNVDPAPVEETVPLDPKAEALLKELLGDVMTKLPEAELRKLAEKIVKAEEGRGDALQDRELLERKISRLAKALEDMERKYQDSLRMGGEAAVQTLGPITTGLNEVDPLKDRKKALLKEIFEQNRVVRELLK